MDRRERFPPKSCTGGPTNGPSGKVSIQKLHRWSNGWTVGKGSSPKVAPVVQRMDHRERFPSKCYTGGPKDGPSGKVSAQMLHRWSSGWTAGKGFRPKVAPVVQRMDHRERFQPKSCTGGPKDGPSGKVSAQKLHRWSNGWTVGKGFHPNAAPVVQRMDRRERVPPKCCTGGPTDGPSAYALSSVPPC